MGHAFHTFYYEVETFEEARAAFRRQQDNDREEHGYGESLDSVAHADEPKRNSMQFTSRRNAEEWLENNHSSYDSIAVQVVSKVLPKDMSDEKKKALSDKLAKATEKEAKKLEKARELLAEANNAVITAEREAEEEAESALGGSADGKLVPCRICKSRININQLLKNTHSGVGECPVCKTAFPFTKSAVVRKLDKAADKHRTLKELCQKANTAFEEKRQEERQKLLEKHGKTTTGWMIGCDVHG